MEVCHVGVREGKVRLKADGFVEAGAAGLSSGGLGIACRPWGALEGCRAGQIHPLIYFRKI